MTKKTTTRLKVITEDSQRTFTRAANALLEEGYTLFNTHTSPGGEHTRWSITGVFQKLDVEVVEKVLDVVMVTEPEVKETEPVEKPKVAKPRTLKKAKPADKKVVEL